MLFSNGYCSGNSSERMSADDKKYNNDQLSILLCVVDGPFGPDKLDEQPQHLLENHTTQGFYSPVLWVFWRSRGEEILEIDIPLNYWHGRWS